MHRVQTALKWFSTQVTKLEKTKAGKYLARLPTMYVAAGVIAAVVLLLGAIFLKSFSCEGPLEKEKMVTVSSGMGAIAIAARLQKEGVLGESAFTALRFRTAAMLSGVTNELKSGTYTFPAEVSIEEILTQLSQGKVTYFYVTIPEGFTAKEITNRLKATAHLKQDSFTIKEGSVLPETYAYEVEESTTAVVARMRAAMDKVVEEAWQSRDANLPIKNKEDLVILASMVEKETSLPEEYGEVAGVFTNRLKKGMKLQSDPTVIYGASNYSGNIQRKHLKEDHPYNTYVHRGLPKGPIANPGKGAVWAAAHPKISDKFYFVATGYGGHVFAKTHAEHQKNVKEYLKTYRKLSKNK